MYIYLALMCLYTYANVTLVTFMTFLASQEKVTSTETSRGFLKSQGGSNKRHQSKEPEVS